VDDLRVRVASNTLSSSTTITVMKNTSATGLAVTVGAGASGLFTDTGAESYSANDTIDLRMVNTNGDIASLAMTACVEVS
jgi:hypothetical protein